MVEDAFARHPQFLIPIVALVGAAVVFTVWIIAHYWARMRQVDAETTLKQDLINRGMTISDIERVLWASSAGPPQPESNTAEVISDNEYYLVEKMLDDGRPVEEIERLVRAFKGDGASASTAIQKVREMTLG
jgi:hypothetical protein